MGYRMNYHLPHKAGVSKLGHCFGSIWVLQPQLASGTVRFLFMLHSHGGWAIEGLRRAAAQSAMPAVALELFRIFEQPLDRLPIRPTEGVAV